MKKLDFKYRKEMLEDYLNRLLSKLLEYESSSDSRFYLNQSSINYNGFSSIIYKQIRNIISDEFPCISNFEFVLDFRTDVNSEPDKINKFFVENLKNYIKNIKNLIDERELYYYFIKFKTDTQEIFKLNIVTIS